eukprot:TRINITY_DN63572_c0_g1_i1.p1 TRINITY_DN63572_c0_g1~~TRINITY_DN63572_c0_g1_i1.p1  ORF type:complete len:655 (+),score=97.21 TRINITY_DN63572_c0_g1_i1:188-1966(+)
MRLCLEAITFTFMARMKKISEAPLPRWVHQSKRKPKGQNAALRDSAARGISLKQLSELGETVRRSLAEHEVVDANPRSASKGQRITWDTATMYHVCEHFVLPLTKAAMCSYVEVLAAERQNPQWLVSHAWSTHFACTLRMLTLHANTRCRQNPMGTLYWCCTLANNQHDLAELSEEDLMKSPFARVLFSSCCMGTVLLCDSAVTPMRRVWCVFEMRLTQRLRDGEDTSKPSHFLDVAAPVYSDAAGTKGDFATSLLQDAVGGNWHECSDTLGAHFPLEVARAGTEVDIVQAHASIPEDRNAILNYVAKGESSRGPPPREHEEYDKLNTFIHSVFASAELYRVACERPPTCLEDMARLLQMRADPNKFIRHGNTALFATIGADPVASTPAPPEMLQPMLELLLRSRADPNFVNSNSSTVLDYAGALSDDTQRLLRVRGALPYSEAKLPAQQQANDVLEQILAKGFAKEGEAFGGSGGGGSGAKVMRVAEQCLHEAAAVLKRYPKASCSITTRATKQDRLKKRGGALKQLLESAGCTNSISLHSESHGPLVRITLVFGEDGAQSTAEPKDSRGGTIRSTLRRIFSRTKIVPTQD